jgi:hypothetical protein
MAERCLKRPRDPIQLGKLIADIATGQVEDRTDDVCRRSLVLRNALGRARR